MFLRQCLNYIYPLLGQNLCCHTLQLSYQFLIFYYIILGNENISSSAASSKESSPANDVATPAPAKPLAASTPASRLTKPKGTLKPAATPAPAVKAEPKLDESLSQVYRFSSGKLYLFVKWDI